jgi:hypothetical protein
VEKLIEKAAGAAQPHEAMQWAQAALNAASRPAGREADRQVQHLREKWPGGQGAHYMEPLVFTPGLSFGKPGDGDWKPLPTSMAATDGSAKGVG